MSSVSLTLPLSPRDTGPSSSAKILRMDCFASEMRTNGTKTEVACRAPRMGSHQTNSPLPFDVLGLVFSYYAEDETIYHPLETLLLVCRRWNDAALGHRTLWSSLRILIGHQPTIDIWTKSLPLRLARCGPDVPLDIVLRNLLNSPHEMSLDSFTDVLPRGNEGTITCGLPVNGYNHCPCYPVARIAIFDILKRLAGQNGELCQRWRSFKLFTGDAHSLELGGIGVWHALTHPTPILATLVLKNLIILYYSNDTSRLFPNTPLLKKLTVLDGNIGSIPGLEAATELEIGITDPRSYYMSIPNFRLGTSLRRLSLWSRQLTTVEFPPELPHLRALELVMGKDGVPRGIFTCKMPQLTSLSLDVFDFATLCELTDGDGEGRNIDLSRVRVLTLRLDRIEPRPIVEYLFADSVADVLERVPNLEYLHANTYSMGCILSIAKNERSGESGFLRGVCLVDLDTKDSFTVGDGGIDEAIRHFQDSPYS